MHTAGDLRGHGNARAPARALTYSMGFPSRGLRESIATMRQKGWLREPKRASRRRTMPIQGEQCAEG